MNNPTFLMASPDDLRAVMLGVAEEAARLALSKASTTDDIIPRARAAEMLGVKPETLRDWERRGILPVNRPGGRRAAYHRSDILALLEQRQTKSASTRRPSIHPLQSTGVHRGR